MGGMEITKDLELYEVVNAFPVLIDSLKKLEFDVLEIREGESVEDFFNRMKLEEDESNIILKRLNRDVKHYFKNSKEESSGINVEKIVVNI